MVARMTGPSQAGDSSAAASRGEQMRWLYGPAHPNSVSPEPAAAQISTHIGVDVRPRVDPQRVWLSVAPQRGVILALAVLIEAGVGAFGLIPLAGVAQVEFAGGPGD